ncbi:MAG: hypothetical protein QM790_13810 [Nibricoccus sp.]
MNTPAFQKALPHVAAAICLLGLGFFLGRHNSHKTFNTPPTAQSTGSFALRSLTAGESKTTAINGSTDDVAALFRMVRQNGSPSLEDSLCAQLNKIASTNPEEALRLAESGDTPRQRELLRNAALHGWATADSAAATMWVLKNVRLEERRTAVEAIAAGAIVDPARAVSTFNQLIASDPQLASDHGNALVSAFSRSGQFEIASKFAASGPAEFRASWLCTVFNQWATYQPQAAVAAIGQIGESAAREEARAGLFAGWSMSDPAALVRYAESLPVGETRNLALKDGLEQWVHLDPAAASAWMDKYDPAPDLDAGAAAIAVAPALIAKKPDVAASWAESITDPELRANTLLDLIRLWAERDPLAAKRYASTSPAIRPETRELALASLQQTP